VKFISWALRHARRFPTSVRSAQNSPPLAFGAASQADGHKRKLAQTQVAQTIVRTRPSDGRLLPPRRKAYQSKELESPPDENSAASQIESGKAASGKMMVSDGKKIKANLAPKTESPPEKKTESPPEKKTESPPQKKGTSADPPKAESGDSAAASSYSRGEGQKPVSKAYKDNWNAIFAKKKKR
jgi:hypothetical protein